MCVHVLLGAGGVGKTTLAAGFALALARSGARVGLLGIDPSRRLQDALGLSLGDLEAPVPGAGALRAAILHPHQALHRWAAECAAGPDALAHLEANPFFAAVGDRLASATDVLAAARLAEWAERDPSLDALVVDTAPGLSAIEFLQHPRTLSELLQGPLVAWLRRAAPGARDGPLHFGARRVLAGFARLAGTGLVAQLADFFALAGEPLRRLVSRLERAQSLLAGADLWLVTSAHDSDAWGARAIAEALRAQRRTLAGVVVNRAWPDDVCRELAQVAAAPALLGHAQAQARAQQRVVAAVRPWSPQVAMLPSVEDASGRAALVALGELLSVQSRLLQPAAGRGMHGGHG